MLLLGRALGGTSEQMKTFAEVVEMTHIGNMLHSNVCEEGKAPSKLNYFFGNKGVILGGDYMISNASILCCKINSMPVIQILCFIVQSMAKGALAPLQGEKVSDKLRNYCNASFNRAASLMAYGCQGIAYLGKADPSTAFEYGKHLGMALKIIGDIKDNLEDKVKFWSFPTLFAANEYPEIETLIEQGNHDQAKQLIKQAKGVDWARKMAIHHLEAAIRHAKSQRSNQELVSLAGSFSSKLY